MLIKINYPLTSLLVDWFALAPGGNFRSIVSGLVHHYDASPLGNAGNRLDMKEFFADVLNTNFVINRTTVNSEVMIGEKVKDFTISFVKPATTIPHDMESFQRICAVSSLWVGTPRDVVISGQTFGKFEGSQLEIKTKVYVGADKLRARALFQDLFAPASSSSCEEPETSRAPEKMRNQVS